MIQKAEKEVLCHFLQFRLLNLLDIAWIGLNQERSLRILENQRSQRCQELLIQQRSKVQLTEVEPVRQDVTVVDATQVSYRFFWKTALRIS